MSDTPDDLDHLREDLAWEEKRRQERLGIKAHPSPVEGDEEAARRWARGKWGDTFAGYPVEIDAFKAGRMSGREQGKAERAAWKNDRDVLLERVIAVERALGLDVERDGESLLLGADALVRGLREALAAAERHIDRLQRDCPIESDHITRLELDLQGEVRALRKALYRHHTAYVHGETSDGCADCALLTPTQEDPT